MQNWEKFLIEKSVHSIELTRNMQCKVITLEFTNSMQCNVIAIALTRNVHESRVAFFVISTTNAGMYQTNTLN